MTDNLPTPPNVADTFGGRLRFLRENAGLSMHDVTMRTGIPTQDLHKLERGERRHIPLSTAAAVADLFGVTIDYLAGR